MKKLISCTMIALLATVVGSIAAPSNDEMMAKETAAWQAFKDKDADGFKKVVDQDMIGVYEDGISDMAKEMSDMQKWDMKSFKISDYKSHSDEKDVVVASYIVTIEGTYDGKDAGGTFNAGSVWKMENGKWLAIFHTNIKQAAMGAAQKKE
ncbi:MAG TPA: nuclear transport factor 2 family protein [Chthoniobacterales bacterium]|nr:nuclear transport factor 2 family protein [Chthoniobacterales bacterium]